MGKRVNTAVWLEKQQRWQIKVQKDGVRKTFIRWQMKRASLLLMKSPLSA